MELHDEIQKISRHQQSLTSRAEHLKNAQSSLKRRMMELTARIRSGETTGDPLYDFYLVHGSSTGKPFGDAAHERADTARRKLAELTPGEVYLFGRRGTVAKIADGVFDVDIPHDNIYIRTTRAAHPETNRLHMFPVNWHTLSTPTGVSGQEFRLPRVTYNDIEYWTHFTVGWPAITEQMRQQPVGLYQILRHFEQPVPDDIRAQAHASYDSNALAIVRHIEQQAKECTSLTKALDAKRKRISELQRKHDENRHAPILRLDDQLQRDAVEMALDAAPFNGPSLADRDGHARRLSCAVKEAITLGLHEYPRTLTVQHDFGKTTTYNIARYITGLAKELGVQLAAEKTK